MGRPSMDTLMEDLNVELVLNIDQSPSQERGPVANRWLGEGVAQPLVWHNQRKNSADQSLRDTVETPDLHVQIRSEICAVLNANYANLRNEERDILLNQAYALMKNGGAETQKIFSGLEKGQKINPTQVALLVNKLLNDHLTFLLTQGGIAKNDKNDLMIASIKAGVEKATRGTNHFGNAFYREGGLDLKANLEMRAAWYEYLYTALFAELQPAVGEEIKEREYSQLLDDAIKLALNELDLSKRKSDENDQEFSQRLAVTMKEKSLAAAYRYLGEGNEKVAAQGKEKVSMQIKNALGGKDLLRLIASNPFYRKLDPEYQRQLADRVVEKCQFGREIGFDFVMEALRQAYSPVSRLDRVKKVLGVSIADAFLPYGEMTEADKILVEDFFLQNTQLSAANFTRANLEEWIKNFAAENIKAILLTNKLATGAILKEDQTGEEPILLTNRKDGNHVPGSEEEPILLTNLKNKVFAGAKATTLVVEPETQEDRIILGEPIILLTRRINPSKTENPLLDTDEHLRRQKGDGLIAEKNKAGFLSEMANRIKQATSSTIKAVRRSWSNFA